MNILVTGASGQLGREFARAAPKVMNLQLAGSGDLDISDHDSVLFACESFRPDWIVNCAAYTQVDRAEEESDAANAANAEGPANLAEATMRYGARLLHISTDFVFDGNQGHPYAPGDMPNPQGVYGLSKLRGEENVLRHAADRSIVIRTAWVYSALGSNFVTTMLRLMKERPELGVVADQVGSPTWAHNLAIVMWKAIQAEMSSGLYHWTDAGVCSWYDFAVAIQEEALELDMLDRAIPIHPIRTEDYPTLARRPSYSVLDKTAILDTLELRGDHWRKALRGMLLDLQDEHHG